ncbi:guanine nucleotide exchange factor for Rab-3A isoform X6 [Crotalus tigris]|uniref:guanine nucleotide exchange factor for Rab-3A isoform X6 n=2 Tax=Crotalus tigris TaxID=88082 RepID=UPI00192F48CE|nr:guanine nucleotide exchange factor for Rab-3A isoform X6 [Crotalus tigris]
MQKDKHLYSVYATESARWLTAIKFNSQLQKQRPQGSIHNILSLSSNNHSVGQAHIEEARPQLQKQLVVSQWKPLATTNRGQELQPPEPSVKSLAGGDENQSVAQLNVSRLRSSSVEIREKGSEFLKEELHRAQKELKLKDEECERLSKVREQLEQELEELTASLFEEAHKMVREANTKQAASEKQLREAKGKIDMLQAEVTALKTLVITSTPSSPNRELHPQLQSPAKTAFRKGHGRNKSTSSTGAITVAGQSAPQESVNSEFKESGVPTLLSLLLCIVPAKAIHITYEPGWRFPAADSPFSSPLSRQVDSILFAEFQAWKESPTLDKSCPFLKRIYHEDVGPCLDFTKHELSELIQAAVEQNTLTIEPAAIQALPVVKVSAIECGGPNGFRSQIITKCALSGLSRACKHRIKLGDSGNYYYISPSCRARITAVCNFFTYIRYIQQGLVRQDVELMYWEVTRLRKEMSIAKLGFYLSEM